VLILEALRAKHGDALLLHHGTSAKPRLILIDGGPPGVYPDAVKPRLDQLRKQQKLDAATPLHIDLVMVSHLDEDHISGVLELMQTLRDEQGPKPWQIDRVWHNTFDDILGNKDASIAATGPLSPASLNDVLAPEGSLVVASVGQGRDLRNLVNFFGLKGNQPFKGLVRRGHAPIKIGDLTFTVVAPDETRLQKLQEEWDEKIKPILKKEKAHKAEIAGFVDRSVYNLSSIVVLVESGGKRILLTGDGRGDHTLEGLEAAGLLDQNARLHLDILKCPHHGSIRDVAKEYFEAIVADHYVISADGKFDNPDVDTLKLISAARKDDKFTLHLTNPPDAFVKPAVGKAVKKFLDADRAAGRKYKVVTRAAKNLSVQIPLDG